MDKLLEALPVRGVTQDKVPILRGLKLLWGGLMISRKEIYKQPTLRINALKGTNNGQREWPEIKKCGWNESHSSRGQLLQIGLLVFL